MTDFPLTVHDVPGRAWRPPGPSLPPAPSGAGPAAPRGPAHAPDGPDAAVAAGAQDLHELVAEGADEAVDEEAAAGVEGQDEVGHLCQALQEDLQL